MFGTLGELDLSKPIVQSITALVGQMIYNFDILKLFPACFDPNITLYVKSNAFLIALQMMSAEGKPNMTIIDFVCQLALEGWFSGKTNSIVDLLMRLYSRHTLSNWPRSFFILIVFAFDLVAIEDIQNLISVFIANMSNLTTVQFEEYIPFFLSRICSQVTALPKSFKDTFWLPLLNELPNSAVEWRDFEDTVSDQTSDFLVAATDELSANLSAKVKESYDLIAAYFIMFDKIILRFDDFYVSHKQNAMKLRSTVYNDYLLDINRFIRSREEFISHIIEPKVDTGRQSLTILSDPIYPSRRMVPSPLIYTVPEFPNGVFDESCITNQKAEIGYFPDCIYSKFTFSWARIPLLMQYHPAFTWYSEKLPISPASTYSQFCSLFNGSSPFLYQCNTSILYGIDPLPGSLFISSDYMYFVDSCKLTSDSAMEFESCHNPMLIQLMVSRYFGERFTYEGHLVIRLRLDEIVSITPHIWIHSPYSLGINFVTGYNFILIFDKYNFTKVSVSLTVERFYEHAPPPCLHPSPISSGRYLIMTPKEIRSRWLVGDLTNFTYLCILNRISSRNYADLTQYPILPWTIAFDDSQISPRDLSKPMGQIGPERAESFDLIYQDTDPHYYYGTHYMHFGVVLYYAHRIDPFLEFSLGLNHGWDHPNRMFLSIDSTWTSASRTNQSDVKELIPQMFCVPELFQNPSELNFISLDNDASTVELPKWANNPRHFVTVMRQHLEEESTSLNLSKWIDLIFGDKSRGPGAEASKNLFHPLCYADKSEDLDSEDEVTREASITCIINFGQCPKQIFKKAHPTKRQSFSTQHILSDSNALVFQKIRNPCQSPNSLRVIGQDVIGSSGVSAILPNGQCLTAEGNALFIQSMNLCSILTSINRVSVSDDGFILAISGHDGFILVNHIFYKKGEVASVRKWTHLRVPGIVTSMSISSIHFVIYISFENKIYSFDIGTKTMLPKIDTDFRVQKIIVDDHSATLLASGDDKIELYSLNGTKYMSKAFNKTITDFDIQNIDEYIKNRSVLVAFADGTVEFLSVDYETMTFTTRYAMTICNEPIVCVTFGKRIIVNAGNSTYCIDYSGNGPLKKDFAIECKQCKSEIGKNITTCPKCGRFFCTKCLPKAIECQYCANGK